MVLSPPNSMEVEASAPSTEPSSSQSVATENTANKIGANPRESIVFCVKAEFVSSPRVTETFLQLLLNLLQVLRRTHTHSLIVYDKNDKIITKFTLENVRSLADVYALFDISSRPGNKTRSARHSIVMNFRSNLSLSEIKSHLEITQYLKEFNIYLRFHHFPRDIIETISPGWLYGYHPTQHDHVAMKEVILARIRHKFPDEVVPYFHLAYSSPSRNRKGGGNRITTKALEIQVDYSLSQKLDKLFCETFAEETFYVKWAWRDRQPDVFRDAMISQSKFLANCRTVPIHGITEDQMDALRSHLYASPTCDSVEMTRSTSKTGRWNFLTTLKNFKAAKTHVQSVLNRFSEIVPEESAALPPSWKMWNEDARTLDNSSDGDQSWLTTSARSFASLAQGDDSSEEAKPKKFDLSYLSAAQGTLKPKSTPAPTETDQSAQIRILTDQVSSLTAQLAAILSPLNAAQTTPTLSTAAVATPTPPATTASPPAAPADPSVSDHLTKLENTLEKFLEIQVRKEQAREARDKASHPIPQTDDDRASKKVDTKTTPLKSPPLGEAGASHVP